MMAVRLFRVQARQPEINVSAVAMLSRAASRIQAARRRGYNKERRRKRVEIEK